MRATAALARLLGLPPSHRHRPYPFLAVPDIAPSTQTNIRTNCSTRTFIEDVDTPYAEYAARGVEFKRGLANMPWHSREFVVKDCDGRLLAFGANL